MIQDTACKDCPFKKMGHDECPNYIETIWHEKDNPQPKIVRDCSPKRTLLMLQEVYNRFIGLQKQVSQAESQIVDCRSTLKAFCELVEKHNNPAKEETPTLIGS